jgi:hypothetical protein
MKKVKMILLLTVMLTFLGFSIPVYVAGADNVGIGFGTYSFMQSSNQGKVGYAVSVDIPTGAKMVSSDSVITYQLIVKTQIFYSDFVLSESVTEVEAECVSTINRKTLGLYTVYFDVGAVVWNFANTDGGNDLITGLYTGLGLDIAGFAIDAGAYILPISQASDIYIVGLSVGRSF